MNNFRGALVRAKISFSLTVGAVRTRVAVIFQMASLNVFSWAAEVGASGVSEHDLRISAAEVSYKRF